MEKLMNVPRLNFEQQLIQEKKAFFIEAGGGVSLPLSGMIYWAILGVLGFFVGGYSWMIIALYGSGLIFPLAIGLSKSSKSNILSNHPLGKSAIYAMVGMFLSYPLIIIGGMHHLALFPLFLAIGMSIHWPVISWMYGSSSCFWHPIVRLVLCVSIFYFLPDFRYTLLPICVAVIYLLTFLGIKSELKKLKQESYHENQLNIYRS